MLLFNPPLGLRLAIQNFISIHLMLLFNGLPFFVFIKNKYFNTSNVTIQLTFCTIFIFCFFISIHLMLLFNSIIDTKREAYINFNTSNVTIQRVINLRYTFCN